jgi:hypothetical protein
MKISPPPLEGRCEEKSLELTPSPPLGERVAEGRVRGCIEIFSHLQGFSGGLSEPEARNLCCRMKPNV